MGNGEGRGESQLTLSSTIERFAAIPTRSQRGISSKVMVAQLTDGVPTESVR